MYVWTYVWIGLYILFYETIKHACKNIPKYIYCPLCGPFKSYILMLSIYASTFLDEHIDFKGNWFISKLIT